ncbi:MAG: Holliday junction resolvase RuvX [Candidatus Magasanikbacteria bacterium]|nr:Holliday junction resolvase RuvX [Candidatus Magasanikbacteria bacterium]
MNVLGIDYGKKRIGLAWVDTALGVVLPYGRLETGDWRMELPKLIREEKADSVIVGLPIGLDGQENENTKAVRKFVEELKKSIVVPVEFVDERFTSRQADQMGGEVSRDEKAAMLILQSYLDKIKR